MAKIYSVLAGGLLSLLALGLQPAAAQTQPLPPRRTCATEDVNAQIQAELKRLNPSYNSARSTRNGAPTALRTQATTYTLPVVVHVINNGETVGTGTNISQAQVQSQIDVLNEDYRNLNADGNNTAVVPTAFQPLRGDVQLQFVMAQRDPSGTNMAEPGIDRVNRNTKGYNLPAGGYTTTYIDATIKPTTYWNPEQYINIWVMPLGNSLLGYAQFPDNTANVGGLSPLGGPAATDGVVVLYTAFGSQIKNPTGTYGTNNPYNRGRTLTHELGHFLGMRHIWGDDDCGNDYVADTPTQFEENYNCPSFPHVTCSNGPSGDMFMNYMDYVNDACMAMFSQAQASRIQAIMAMGTPRRTNLLSSPAICTSVVSATVGAPTFTACTGSSVTLTATGPTGATYYWTGPNGYTSTTQNPVLTNATALMAGTYAVTVSVGSGACPVRLTTNLVVNPVPPIPALTSSATAAVCPSSPVTLTNNSPLPTGTLPSTNFNSGAPTGWTIGNTGVAAATWQYSAGNTINYARFRLTGYSLDGTRFAYAISDAGGAGSQTNTTLTSPVFSTVGYSALSLSFQHALIIASGAGLVEISTDGGTTWAVAATYYGADDFNPTTATINLAGYLNQSNVRLRWHYTDTYGYLWAIDNVAFTGTPATYSYAWSLVSGDGLPTTTNTASLVATPTQSSVYRLTVGYAGGSCTSSSTVSVNVYPTPTLVTSAALACPGSPATLSATNAASIASFSPTYAWSLVSGDGLPATTNAATISVTPTQNSVYRLTVTYPGSCPLSSTVSVGVVPTPTLAASASVVCAGSTSQLSATNIPTAGYTYVWSLVSGDGLPATVNTPTITVSPTKYSVYRLTVSNSGCSTSATVVVTGITNVIDAYPVPFGDAGLSLQVSTCTAGPASVQIYDIMGRRVYDSTVGTPQVGTTTVSMPETGRLRPGKYIVKVQQGTQNTTFNVVRQ